MTPSPTGSVAVLLVRSTGAWAATIAVNSSARTRPNPTTSASTGPDPEGVTLGKVGGRTYAFLGLERVGGVMVYDVTDPARASFVTYVNNRDFAFSGATPAAGDLGPEGLTFIAAEDSPTGRPLVGVGNEVSGSTTLLDVRRALR